MPLAGFTAEASLYQTSRHYRTVGTLEQNDGVSLQQFAAPVSGFPGFHHCGPCYRDSTGACVRDCISCPPGQLPDGCDEYTVGCAPSACPQPICPPGCRRFCLPWRLGGRCFCICPPPFQP